MRVLLFTEGSESQKELILKENKDIAGFINIDDTTDFSEAEYLLGIRSYSKIYIQFSESYYKKIYNMLGELKHQNNNHEVVILMGSEDSHIATIFKKHVSEIYSSVNAKLIHVSNVGPHISDQIRTYFFEAPDMIESFEIDLKTRSVALTVNSKELKVKVKSAKDFQILLFFIKNYGETLNIDTILSGVFHEPELGSASPIESAISVIRNLLGRNSIKALKRVGYRFAL